jgi:hypothetical protein
MMVRNRISSASGYDPSMPPRRMERLAHGMSDAAFVARNPKVAALLGIGIVTAPRWYAPVLNKHGFTTIMELPPDDVLLFHMPVPRARIVHRASFVPDEEASYAATVDHYRDPSKKVVIEATDPGWKLAEPLAGAQEEAAIVVDLPERVEIDAHLAAPGVLVLTDTWYPGWTAEVDGAAQPILRADYGFRALFLPPGTHRVVFRYAPVSLRYGFWITLLAAIVAGAFLVRGRRAAVAPVVQSSERACSP